MDTPSLDCDMLKVGARGCYRVLPGGRSLDNRTPLYTIPEFHRSIVYFPFDMVLIMQRVCVGWVGGWACTCFFESKRLLPLGWMDVCMRIALNRVLIFCTMSACTPFASARVKLKGVSGLPPASFSLASRIMRRALFNVTAQLACKNSLVHLQMACSNGAKLRDNTSMANCAALVCSSFFFVSFAIFFAS